MSTPFEQLPDQVQAYALGGAVAEAADQVAEKYGLEDGFTLIPLVKRILLGEDPAVIIPATLKGAGVESSDLSSAAADFALLALKPIDQQVGGVDALIRSWGGDPTAEFEEEITEAEEVVIPPPAPVTPPPTPTPVIPTIKPEVVKPPPLAAPVAPISSDAVVMGIVSGSGVQEVERQKRLARIVEARLKDVRDAYATRAELEKPIASGGLGLTGRAVADVMERIESAAYEARRETDTRVMKEKAAHVEKNIVRRDASNTLRAQEEQLLARRYAELTGKAPIKPVGATGARPSLAVSGKEALAQAAKKIDTAKVKQAIAVSKPPVLRPAVSRPRMEDVKPMRRLAGPVEELGMLTLEDFRRLSKDPLAAVAKILDQAELVRAQGEEKWVAAVQAWRTSPLSAWYVGAMQEALMRGVDTRALLAEKRAAGQTVPTEQELDAMITLNGRLRF